MVCPGAMRPLSSASSMRARATRSFTEPVGLNDSILAQMRTPGLGLSRLSSTSGVLPIAWTRSPYRPPHGRFSRGGSGTTQRIVPGRPSMATRAPRFLSLGLHGLLERRGRLEARHARRGDLHGLAGLRVATLARGALGDAELPEAREAGLVASRELVRDGLEGRLDRFLRLAAAQAGLLGDCTSELGLVDGCHEGLLLDGVSRRRYGPGRTEKRWRLAAPARHGGQDDQHVALADLGVETLQDPDVLVVEVHVDVAVEVAAVAED